MKAAKRFILALLASFWLVMWDGSGLIPKGMPGLASEPATPTTSPVETVPAHPPMTRDDLEVEPASIPDNTLPTPYPEPPDGTLKLPHPIDEAAVEAPPAADAPADPEATEPSAEGIDPAELLAGLAPDIAKRSQLLMEGDRLYLAGDVAAAEAIYRRAKESKWLAEGTSNLRVTPITNPDELPPAGQVYWREAQAGLESAVPSRVLVPLALLVEEYPEFLPGQALYARYLVQQGQPNEALKVLEAAITRYPYHPDLLKAQTEVQMAQEQWIEAAITANQFALLNPDHPEAGAMAQLAVDNLDRFRGQMNQTLTQNLLANIITGAAGYFLTGGLLGPFTAINSGVLLMQGETALGQQVATQVKRQLPVTDDPEIRAYVNDMGQKLAALTGRDEFEYTFEVILDDTLNAFALPGGKVFINAGAITKTYSEAELAGLLSHEISHAVLSHGFQLATQGNLTSSLAAFIPIPEVGDIAANLVVSGYSREMERQADIFGTKLLASGQYAADGLHNLMVTLKKEDDSAGVRWFASHPAPDDRVSYLKQLVDQGGYNRYAYEGVATHLRMRQKMAKLMTEYKQEQGIEADEGEPDQPN
ncbi:MAG: M48 family metalloprotease [Nodosilinea sp.]